MKSTIIKDVPEKYTGMAEYLEALNFEVESRKSLLVFAIEKGLQGNESFEEYEREYKEFFVKYDQAKREFSRTAISEMFGENAGGWSLDFASKRVSCVVEETR